METITHTHEVSKSGEAILKANYKNLNNQSNKVLEYLLTGKRFNMFVGNQIGIGVSHSRVAEVSKYLAERYNISLNRKMVKIHETRCYDYWLDTFSIIRIKEGC